MTGLVVSVRDAAEAAWVAGTGATLVDVKEPSHGSLGAATPATLAAAAQAVAGRKPLSAALGELHDDDAIARCRALPAGYAFAKLGLAGMAGMDDLSSRWREAMQALPRGTAPIAAAYADWERCGAPRPQDVLEVGAAGGCVGLLVDTYDKGHGGLFDLLAGGELAALFARARALGLFCVAAGSLSREAARRSRHLGADLVAARGALCVGGRTAELDAALVAGWCRDFCEGPAAICPGPESPLAPRSLDRSDTLRREGVPASESR